MARVGRRFREALDYAATLHEDHRRKHGRNDPSWIPYISHLLGTASLVLEVGGSEDEAIAALLHDAIEDQRRDGLTEKEIGERFSPQVLEIVMHCTKKAIDKSGPDDVVKARRKEQTHDYVEHLRGAPDPVKLVAAADKLNNARAIVRDYRKHGDDVWVRFNKTKQETLDYYQELVPALRGCDERAQRLVDELEQAVNVMHELAGQPTAKR
jgi:(p)ppGpp synthase/HD superfamily hydrolase